MKSNDFLIMGAVAVGGYLILSNWNKLKEGLSGFGGGMMKGGADAGQGLSAIIETAGKIIKSGGETAKNITADVVGTSQKRDSIKAVRNLTTVWGYSPKIEFTKKKGFLTPSITAKPAGTILRKAATVSKLDPNSYLVHEAQYYNWEWQNAAYKYGLDEDGELERANIAQKALSFLGVPKKYIYG